MHIHHHSRYRARHIRTTFYENGKMESVRAEEIQYSWTPYRPGIDKLSDGVYPDSYLIRRDAILSSSYYEFYESGRIKQVDTSLAELNNSIRYYESGKISSKINGKSLNDTLFIYYENGNINMKIYRSKYDLVAN